MKFLLKVAATIVTAVLMFIPSYIWFGMKSMINPVGFWENLAIAGLGI